MKLKTSMFALLSAYSSIFSLEASNTSRGGEWREELLSPGQGALIGVYKQDPKVYDTTIIDPAKHPLIKQVYINRKIESGPKDPEMKVVINKVSPDSEGNFISLKVGTPEFDSAHAYAVVRQVYDMWRGTIDTIRQDQEVNSTFQKIVKRWDERGYGILKINTHAGTDMNAYYSRNGAQRDLKFFDFQGNDGKPVSTCQSADVVAHETGHAVLDIMHPEYFETNNLQTGGLHEAFGDITSLFFILNQDDLAENLIVSTKGDLHRPNFASFLAEQFGEAVGLPSLRNADKDYRIDQVAQEVHDVSQVFVGAIYDSFVQGFNEACTVMKGQRRLTQVLQDTADYYRMLLLHAIINDTSGAPTFGNIANTMINLADSYSRTSSHYLRGLSWKSYINDEFTRRGIGPESHGIALKPVDTLVDKVKKVRICGTLPHKFGSNI